CNARAGPAALRPMGRAWVVALPVLLVRTAIPAGAQPDLESARARLAEARERVAEAQKRADAAAAELSAAETALAEVELELERLEDAISLAESEIDGMREELRRFAIEQYVGRSDPPPFLASEEDLGAAVRAEALSEIVSGANGDVLDRYRLFAAELDTARKEAA